MYIQHMYTVYTIIHGGYAYIQNNGAQNDRRFPKHWSTARNCMWMVGFTTWFVWGYNTIVDSHHI